jgi:hypothetical protein
VPALTRRSSHDQKRIATKTLVAGSPETARGHRVQFSSLHLSPVCLCSGKLGSRRGRHGIPSLIRPFTRGRGAAQRPCPWPWMALADRTARAHAMTCDLRHSRVVPR